MDRLTRYVNDIAKYNYAELAGGISQAVCNKLGKLEDLEKELGCPLEIVFKALQQGYIFYEWDNDKRLVKENITHITIRKNYNDYIFNCIQEYENGYEILFSPNLKDYKKTWWLREDKSE